MRQLAKIVDITKTFLPIDPQYMAENLHTNSKGDYPASNLPVVAYEGYNFLPTAYGYKSYFGTAAKFAIDAIPSRVDKVFIFESSDFQNMLVALCENGIYTNLGLDYAPAWTLRIPLPTPDPGTKRLYTTCMIGNKLYIYRQGSSVYWVMSPDGYGAVQTIQPNFLNMEGQIGIFKAGGRLGFWDSMESIAWSNLDDLADFEPSVETLAGSAIFNNVKGNITFIHSCEEGFIIYATKSVVLIKQDLGSTFQWDPKVLMTDVGVAYPEQIAVGSPDTKQYFYSNKGMYKLEQGTPEVIVTEVTDLLSESTAPIALSFLENRYLALKLMESKFVEGLVQLYSETYPTTRFSFPSMADLQSLDPSYTVALLSNGMTKEQQDLAKAAIALANLPPMQDGTMAKPRWYADMTQRDAPIEGTFGDFKSYNNITGIMDAQINNQSVIATVAMTHYAFDQNGTPYSYNGVEYYAGQSTPWKQYVGFDFGLYQDNAEYLKAFIELQKTAWSARDDQHKKILDELDTQVHLGTGNSAGYYASPAVSIQNGSGRFMAVFDRGYFRDMPIQYTPINGGGSFYRPTPAQHYGVVSMLTDPTEIKFQYNACSVVGEAVYTNADCYEIICTTSYNEYDQRVDSFSMGGRYKKTLDRNFRVSGMARIIGWEYTDVNGNNAVAGASACPNTGFTPIPFDLETVPVPDVGGPLDPYPWNLDPIDVPGATIEMQNGSQGPIYPEYKGALVYDTEYKKWGKMKLQFTQLLDLSPINTNQGKIVTSKRFGIDAAAVLPTKLIHRFDSKPVDSYLKYGKLGYQRLGYTKVEEVRVQFRTPCTGTLEVEASLDGRNPEQGLVSTTTYQDATHLIAYPSLSGQWQNITFRGNYDITGLEYRGVAAGRR